MSQDRPVCDTGLSCDWSSYQYARRLVLPWPATVWLAAETLLNVSKWRPEPLRPVAYRSVETSHSDSAEFADAVPELLSSQNQHRMSCSRHPQWHCSCHDDTNEDKRNSASRTSGFFQVCAPPRLVSDDGSRDRGFV